MTKHCDYFAAYYPMLNRDLIVTAAIFHDIGKLEELSVFPENDYTDEGQLLGHIMIGAEMVGERIRTIEGFPVRMANEFKTLYSRTSRRAGIWFAEEAGTCRSAGTQFC